MNAPLETNTDTNTPPSTAPDAPAGAAPAPPKGRRGPSLRRFTPRERERLERLRQAVRDGERSESFPVDRRQDFVRWLIANGRLSES
jgi:hypothetical protein